MLAGGIAHDFNNILTAIIGNAELALMRLNPESPVARQPAADREGRRPGRRPGQADAGLLGQGEIRGRAHRPEPPGGRDGAHAGGLHLQEGSAPLQPHPAAAGGQCGCHPDPPDHHEPGHQRLRSHRRRSGVIAITTGCLECNEAY